MWPSPTSANPNPAGILVKTLLTPVRRQDGFSLVELMVGMVIGLVAVVIMFQVFAVSEAQRRTTTGSGDAQQNGASALFIMERDARMAGYGIAYWKVLGCNSFGHYRKTGTNFNFTLAPVITTDGGAAGPDSITFMYGNPSSFALPAPFTNASNTYASALQIMSPRFQFEPGDVMLSAEVPAAGGALKNCWVTQVTALSPTNGDQITISGGTYDDNGTTRTADYSPPFTVPVTYVKWNTTKGIGGRLFNLGPQPVAMTYSIVNDQLVATNAFDGVATPIADNIVQFQVQLGYSPLCAATGLTAQCNISSLAPVTTIINTATSYPQGVWGDTLGPVVTPSDYRKVIAVRMAIVARSSTPEKKDTMGNCNATTVEPVWLANSSSTLKVSGNPEWRCYRYKVFELMMPLRNMLWFADPDGTPVPPA